MSRAPPVAPLPKSLIEEREPSGCRVIAARPVKGARPDAGPSSATLAMGTALPGVDWVSVEANTELVLRHAATTRELALRGPGRFLPCFLGTETVLVATGTVKTTAGAGARAGAEVILATPLGALHFADAALELSVREREVETAVTTGTVTLVSAKSQKTIADAGAPDLVFGAKSRKKLTGAPNVEELVARCSEASGALAAGPPGLPPGAPSARALRAEWSVAQLRARQAARWACAIARAAAGRVDGPEGDRLWDRIAAMDRVWLATPTLGVDAGK